VKSLERRQTAARKRLETLLGVVDSDPKGAENRPHMYNYKLNLNPQEDTVIAAKECSRAGGEGFSQSPAPVQPKRSEKGMVHGIAPDELVKLAPKLKPWLRRPNPTWPDIVDAAEWLGQDLGVSRSLWGNACLAMGRELAAVALAIVSTKGAEHFRTSPGGYFHGMVGKAIAPEVCVSWANRTARQDSAMGICSPTVVPRERHARWRVGVEIDKRERRHSLLMSRSPLGEPAAFTRIVPRFSRR
jgi:replication initiation protein RepC